MASKTELEREIRRLKAENELLREQVANFSWVGTGARGAGNALIERGKKAEKTIEELLNLVATEVKESHAKSSAIHNDYLKNLDLLEKFEEQDTQAFAQSRFIKYLVNIILGSSISENSITPYEVLLSSERKIRVGEPFTMADALIEIHFGAFQAGMYTAINCLVEAGLSIQTGASTIAFVLMRELYQTGKANERLIALLPDEFIEEKFGRQMAYTTIKDLLELAHLLNEKYGGRIDETAKGENTHRNRVSLAKNCHDKLAEVSFMMYQELAQRLEPLLKNEEVKKVE
jgi:hypothetical protein